MKVKWTHCCMALLAAAQWPQRSAGFWGCPAIVEAEHSRKDIFTTDWKMHDSC